MHRDDGTLWLASRHARSPESWHTAQGRTNDCGPHAAALAINFWHGEPRTDPHALARMMNRPRLGPGLIPLVVRRIPHWATFPWGIVDVLRQQGIAARWRFFAAEEQLHRALAEDRLALVIFGEPLRRKGRLRWAGWSHVALLVGWNPAAQTYWFVDSAQSRVPYPRPRDDFRRLWANLGRILIEMR